MKEVNQCAHCKYGPTLRIHVLTGHRNCKAGRHPPGGICKDFKKHEEDLVENTASGARAVAEKLVKRGYKVRVYPIYEDNIRKYLISSWKEK